MGAGTRAGDRRPGTGTMFCWGDAILAASGTICNMFPTLTSLLFSASGAGEASSPGTPWGKNPGGGFEKSGIPLTLSFLTLIPNSFSNLSSKEGLLGELLCLCKSLVSDRPNIAGGGTLISRGPVVWPDLDIKSASLIVLSATLRSSLNWWWPWSRSWPPKRERL